MFKSDYYGFDTDVFKPGTLVKITDNEFMPDDYYNRYRGGMYFVIEARPYSMDLVNQKGKLYLRINDFKKMHNRKLPDVAIEIVKLD